MAGMAAMPPPHPDGVIPQGTGTLSTKIQLEHNKEMKRKKIGIPQRSLGNCGQYTTLESVIPTKELGLKY
jgi:hypothetical protein